MFVSSFDLRCPWTAVVSKLVMLCPPVLGWGLGLSLPPLKEGLSFVSSFDLRCPGTAVVSKLVYLVGVRISRLLGDVLFVLLFCIA